VKIHGTQSTVYATHRENLHARYRYRYRYQSSCGR